MRSHQLGNEPSSAVVRIKTQKWAAPMRGQGRGLGDWRVPAGSLRAVHPLEEPSSHHAWVGRSQTQEEGDKRKRGDRVLGKLKVESKAKAQL